ncbi:GerMN domain-containing protein [Aneurinibacillus sp. Ricciae_BoGa-3]|uniref:GerMN domain-containing protein n=1 Tax=Aneurinibacillus sp. Ricciae_BoGa-3 TaxID=3022697 RepID=UPI00234051FF|nr:GerMN domain-containing protein [Aneurinibacillus sp. Ricciae_BoGa-3]WCK53684.1 GerMN domain-containing protein [Aneurinibacillus sp. Ricciae_BoGa-3]
MSQKIMITGALIGLLVLSGCSMFGPNDVSSTQQIDPPKLDSQPAGSEKVTANGQPLTDVSGKTAKAEAKTMIQKLYVVDTDGYVVPWEMEFPKTQGMAKQVLSYMVKGSQGEKMLPKGLHAVLPQGTKIIGMTIKNGVATVDFSPEFKNYKAEDEQKIIDAITWTLTEFDSVKEVNIRINGHDQEVMPVKGTPISHLSRKNGINLELADNVKIGQTTPVTLYFEGQLPNDKTYFVPVTRLVTEKGTKAETVVKELVRGPRQGSTLVSSILPSVGVLSVKEKNNVVVADFDKQLIAYNQGEANPDAMTAIVLSLTENTGAKKVQIMVDGKSKLKAGNMDYSKPVSKPAVYNTRAY